MTYGIEGAAGVVVINMTEQAGDIDVISSTATTTGSTTTTTTTLGTNTVVDPADAPVSLSITTSARGTNGSADIGTLNIVGAGETSTFDPITDAFVQAPGAFTAPENMSVAMTGKSPINVWSLIGSNSKMLFDTASIANNNTPTLAGMGTVSNATSGELVNFAAADVISLSAQTLGLSNSDTPAAVGGAPLINGVLPFGDQRTLVQIGGSLVAPGSGASPITGIIGNDLRVQYEHAAQSADWKYSLGRDRARNRFCWKWRLFQHRVVC